MDTSTAVQRKKVGRPPKAVPTLMQTVIGDEAALVAISPIPDEQSHVTTSAGIMDTSAECRRSSRKKIIKFDVRDLLNKHRKPHKIQIEARIDSNAPSPSSSSTASGSEIHSTNKEKCFIEKTSIIQRSIAFDNSQHGPTQVPISLKTQIFKPNQASSLIVAQMESLSSTSTQAIQNQPKSTMYNVEMANKLNATVEADIVLPKRRGRPPKNRSVIEKPIEEDGKNESVKEVTVSNELSDQIKDQTAKTPHSYLSKPIEVLPVENPGTTFQMQFENESNRLDAPEDKLSTNYDTQLGTEKINLTGLQSLSVECKNQTTTKSCDSEKKCSTDEPNKNYSLFKTDSTADSLKSPTKCIIPNESLSNRDHNESIVFEKKIPEVEQKLEHEQISATEAKAKSCTNITLPIKKQLSKLKEIQAVIKAEELAKDSIMLNLCPAKNVPLIEIQPTKDTIAESETARKTSTPTPQRSERRSGRRLGDGSNKTLEETFAEIAANSSKAILDMSPQIDDEPSSSEAGLATEEIATQSIDPDFSKIENITPIKDVQTMSNKNDTELLVSPEEETLDQHMALIKRRGRKPKPKEVDETNESMKDAEIVEKDLFVKTELETKTCIQEKPNINITTSSDISLFNKIENQNAEDENFTEKLSIDIKSSIDRTPTKVTPPKNLPALESSNKTTETESTETETTETPSMSTEKLSKEHKMRKKDPCVETLSSKKSISHHKHRKHEDYTSSSSSQKNDQNTPKHRSSSTEKTKKYRKTDTEETNRKERKSLESSKKSKPSFKESFREETKKVAATSESSKNIRYKSEDEDAKKVCLFQEICSLDSPKKASISQAFKDKPFHDDMKKSSSEKLEYESTNKPASVYKESSAVDSLKSSSLLSPERVLDESYQKAFTSPKENEKGIQKSIILAIEKPENESLKNEKFAVDNLKKLNLLLSEKVSIESSQKSTKIVKDRPTSDDLRKSTTLKDKSSSEGMKKSSSKERNSTELYAKKSCSSTKEKLPECGTKKSTPDERHRKTISKESKERAVDDSLKKTTPLSTEKTVPEDMAKIEKAFDESLTTTSQIVERKHDDKKKHKLKSQEASTSKSKIFTSSNVSPISTSSNKNQDSKSHKRKRKHKESPETKRIKDNFKSSANTNEKIKNSSSSKDEKKSLEKKIKDGKKHAHKERQKKLTEALRAAMTDNPEIENQFKPEIQAVNVNVQNQAQMLPESYSEIQEISLPPTPGESDAAGDEANEHTRESCSSIELHAETTESKSTTVVESDPLYDIEKFIEAGVNLLKRDYKLDEDDEVKTNEINKEKIKEEQTPDSAIELEHSTKPRTMEDIRTEQSNVTENLETKQEVSSALDFYETPASTPVSVTPSSSPTPADNSVDTYYYSDGVRRSHRLKKITNAPKALVGRGLVRDRDRERLAMRDDVETKSYYSIEDHLMDLAEVEAKNAKFLKEMEERLSNFEVIKENEYHCERVVSREARKMFCDCFLTPEESERGELGCGEDCLNRLLMIECGVNCKVGERCTNNRFQKYLCAPCRVFRTEKKGFGIMADVEIHPGEFIMEYVGEVLDSEEFEDRRVAYSQDKNRHYYFMALRSDAIIDATLKGNVSRFINHSCDPNAETQKWTVNGELRIGFFSRKTIMPGEEITFDYQYQRYGREAQRCYCESANCRGWIGEEPASDEGEQLEDGEDDDEDDDDEYDEDESDVVSMVKGLMSVEDGEDEDGKDEIMSEETRRNIQDAAVKAQLRKNQSLENEEISTMKEANLEGESDESKQKFMAYLSKISAKIELHKKNVREEKKRKRQQRKQAANERRPPTTANARFLEDPDLEDEIDFLSRCGLKNQSDTLRLSRLMVRAKLVPTRLNLLAILRAGELPCRRLFLDYHGLHLLHGWINEDSRTDMTIRMALLETLESLPIPNKTILTESKVYQAVRGWSSSESLPTNSKVEGSSSSPSDDSSKESGTGNVTEKQMPTVSSEVATDDNDSPMSELEKLAMKLLNSWDNLPEIFRIPKRERIEQMKEHEREADRQYAATVEADNENDQKELSTDRYQRDRFERRFGRPQGTRTITVLGAGGLGGSSKRLISTDILSPDDTKHLSKEQRRELFAAKVARDEAEKRQAELRREFETKCTFFGLDPLVTRQEDIPFCVSDSGKWYNERRQLITTPPAFAHVQAPTKPMSTNPTDYYLPSAATKLPPDWAYAITEQGKIYYYHLKHRVPQWEPPTIEQINKTKWSDGESESDEDSAEEARELSEERIKEIEAIETQEELNAFLKKIVQEQRQTRYKRLVDERPISPRREEDRIYNQIEMRKYKENKEKIKKRKEEIRRRRSEAIKNSMLNMCTLGSLEEKPTTSSVALENMKNDAETSDISIDALPIQDYLLSSDEDTDHIDEMKAECNNSSFLDKIVQGDKIVDELDGLTTKRQLKRALPPHRDLNFDLNIISSESLLASIEKIEQKKRKQEKKEKSKRNKESSDAKYRKLKEKFRCEIAGIIVQHLKPYRKDSCIFGRIKSNEDFNHLAKKLTHFVMIKELKYCESVGQTLIVTQSVKNKSREFIRKYMAKYEAGYVKPNNDPEFKDIPYTL